MVVTRLWEVTNKGKEWASSSASNQNINNPDVDRVSSSPSYWEYATNSLQGAAASALGGMVSSFYGGDSTSNFKQGDSPAPSYFYNPFFFSLSASAAATPNITSRLSSIEENYENADELPYATPSGNMTERRSTKSSPWYKTPHSDLVWMFRNNKNPYNAVRVGDTQPYSLKAVRSLVALVPTRNEEDYAARRLWQQKSGRVSAEEEDETEVGYPDHSDAALSGRLTSPPPPPPPSGPAREFSLLDYDDNKYRRKKAVSSPSETASQLAEGTIRALRDLALDEAVELQAALRYWNIRWERPLLSWLEAGPLVWTSVQGYNHQEIGRKVSHIQAVLARRCAAIGELQQHLLRAGWHRGVAQWGVLGEGGQWAPVAGFDGAMPIAPADSNDNNNDSGNNTDEIFSPEMSKRKGPPTSSFVQWQLTDSETAMADDSSSLVETRTRSEGDIPYDLPRSPTHIGGCDSLQHGRSGERQSAQAQVFVGKRHGGGIFVDDPAFLAEWSVDAMKLIRRHLFRAGNGRVSIPCESNWVVVPSLHEGVVSPAQKNIPIVRKLPLWASDVVDRTLESTRDDATLSAQSEKRVTIADLPLMVSEVSELLDIMEGMMAIQRRRRLDRVRAPSWLRSNWYVVATVGPPLAFLVRRLVTKGYGKQAIKILVNRVTTFFRERVVDPAAAIFNEVWQGRENFSDQKARMEAFDSLKKMIRSWLDDTFPEMPESERISMAEAMDVSMVERKKEESMKTFYEINNVVRMSFIEMQYMKKEMMNALHAIDEMMSANDINMNLAAITPAVLLVYGSSRVFRFFFYALLKLGKSREETYASFRHILTDIERLLVMRDNPPNPPPFRHKHGDQIITVPSTPCVLGSDDLGMLMLLIHECRSILWRERWRFSEAVIRSVSEDLAELAGERGAISVQQQLSIVGRMCRSYPFLKVVSIGHLFQYESLRHV